MTKLTDRIRAKVTKAERDPEELAPPTFAESIAAALEITDRKLNRREARDLVGGRHRRRGAYGRSRAAYSKVIRHQRALLADVAGQSGGAS